MFVCVYTYVCVCVLLLFPQMKQQRNSLHYIISDIISSLEMIHSAQEYMNKLYPNTLSIYIVYWTSVNLFSCEGPGAI